MAQIIESIPNISEGRDKQVIQACVDQIRTTPGCTLLNYSSDPNHNRTVISYIGDAKGVEEASVKLAKKAVELIDLTKHTGEHPRMGCVDVMPFVPIKDATNDDCIRLSVTVGQRIADEAGLPVFLYEMSARKEARKNLAAIRKGQFEGMAEKVKDPEWEPDFGGARIHPKIAKVIREKDGGLANVKAMGFMLEDRNIAQVSINMTDYRVTPLYRVTELVKSEAKRYGVTVIGSEVVGLCPMKALIDCAEYYLQIEDFDFNDQVLENYII